MVSFLEKLIEIDCGEKYRSLSQVGKSRWILLLREYFFSAWSSDWRGGWRWLTAPIGVESVSLQAVALPQTRSRVIARLFCVPLREIFDGFRLSK